MIGLDTARALWRRVTGAPRAVDITPMPIEELVRRMNVGSMSASGILVSADSASRFAAVASCERVLSDSAAMLPLGVYRKDGTKRLPDPTHPVHKLIHDRPNENQTAPQWKKLHQVDLIYRGRAYSLIVRGFGGRISELIRLHPDRMVAEQDDVTQKVTFRYTRANGREIRLERRDVFHIWKDSFDGIDGVSPVTRFRETIGDGIAMRDHGARFFSNGGKPSGVLQAAGKIDAPSKAAMRSDFESLYGGEGVHRTAVLDQGTTYEAVTMSNEDAQYIDSRKFNRSEIAGIFGVPPFLIGDIEKQTSWGTGVEQIGIGFVVYSLSPWFAFWEASVNRDLLEGDDSLYSKFNEKALLRGDFKSRQEGLQIQRQNGVIDANEWRAAEDMNDLEGPEGTQRIVPANMQASPIKPPEKPDPQSKQEPKP